MLNEIKAFVTRNETTILICAGLAGFVSTTIAATKATPKAIKMRMDVEEETGDLTVKQEAQIVAKCYWPVALGMAASAACIIFAHKMDLKKNAAILTAYTISESRLIDYKKAMKKILTPKDQEKVRDEVAKKNIEAVDPVYIENTSGLRGDYLCFEPITGRYFKSNIEKIRKAVNDINATLINQNFAYLNDFYYNIGLEQVDIGDKLGWSMHCLGDQLEMEFSSQVTKNGEPCLVLVYETEPVYINVDGN